MSCGQSLVVSEVPPQIPVLAALLIVVAGCDQGTVAGLEEDGGAPGSPTMHVADEAASVDHLAGAVPDGLLDLTAGRQRGARSVDGEAVPAWIESMLEVELPEGYSVSDTPRRPEIRDVRLRTDALNVIRPDRSPYENPPPPDDPPDPGNPPIICPETVGAHGDCPPIEDPPEPPPPPPPPPPGEDPLYIQGGSYVMRYGWNDMVDFGSYTVTSRPVAYLSVTGFSFIDGWLEAIMEDQ